MDNKDKSNSVETIEDMIELKKNMQTHAKVLVILGVVGIVGVGAAFIWYIVSHSVNHSSIRFSDMLYYMISIVIFTVMLSAGKYMANTSQVIDIGIKNKINEKCENIDDKKE